MSSLYSHGCFPGSDTTAVRIDSGDKNVLACRQVGTVASALGKASRVLSVDGQDKDEIFPKICDPSNDHMT